MKRIIIYRESGCGKMYLCPDGTLSSERADAQEHWLMQFEAIVAEHPILGGFNFEPGFEEVGANGGAS